MGSLSPNSRRHHSCTVKNILAVLNLGAVCPQFVPRMLSCTPEVCVSVGENGGVGVGEKLGEEKQPNKGLYKGGRKTEIERLHERAEGWRCEDRFISWELLITYQKVR